MPQANDVAIAETGELLARITTELGRFFIGQQDLVELVLTALLADGHVMVESVPGLGKTLLVKAVGRIWGLETNRIQFTPDLMPSDITGSHVFDMAQREFVFRPGPVFTQYLLADEFNRAPAKTHAALLECMQERQVTLDGNRYELARPFLVLATQNPIENEGTYALPEAQLDRFLFKIDLGYPEPDEERRMLDLFRAGTPPERGIYTDLPQVGSPELLQRLQRLTETITVQDQILTYILEIVRHTRGFNGLYLGASPRAGIALLTASRALALIRGRGFVIPDDVADVALPAMRHRVILSPEAEVEGKTADGLLTEVLRSVNVPHGINDGQVAADGSGTGADGA